MSKQNNSKKLRTRDILLIGLFIAVALPTLIISGILISERGLARFVAPIRDPNYVAIITTSLVIAILINTLGKTASWRWGCVGLVGMVVFTSLMLPIVSLVREGSIAPSPELAGTYVGNLLIGVVTIISFTITWNVMETLEKSALRKSKKLGRDITVMLGLFVAEGISANWVLSHKETLNPRFLETLVAIVWAVLISIATALKNWWLRLITTTLIAASGAVIVAFLSEPKPTAITITMMVIGGAIIGVIFSAMGPTPNDLEE